MQVFKSEVGNQIYKQMYGFSRRGFHDRQTRFIPKDDDSEINGC